MARTWVFFLIIIQITINIGYGLLVVNFNQALSFVIAGALLLFFILKIGSVLIFVLKRFNKSSCCAPKYDPSDNRYSKCLFQHLPFFFNLK